MLKKIPCYYCTILYNTVIVFYINTVSGVSFNQFRCYLTPPALSLFLFFLFLLQRTVFPKDYHVVHYYRTSMFCDDDPVSSLPDQSSKCALPSLSYCADLVNAEFKKRFAAPWIIDLACKGATGVVFVIIRPMCFTLTLSRLFFCLSVLCSPRSAACSLLQ